MATRKQKAHEPTLHDFRHACVYDKALAQQMLRENSSWLHTANGSGETALAYLVIENQCEAVRFLLDAGADINTRDRSAETPLIQAAGLGCRDMVALLLERGATINAQNVDQETALFQAVRWGHLEICEALLRAGADVQVQNDLGETLSDVALPRKSAQVLSVLSKYGYQEPAPPTD